MLRRCGWDRTGFDELRRIGKGWMGKRDELKRIESQGDKLGSIDLEGDEFRRIESKNELERIESKRDGLTRRRRV